MRSIKFFMVFLALLILLPLTAQAAPVGKFTRIIGSVDITTPGEAVRPTQIGDEVQVGDIIRTKSKSKAEITFNDDNILRLAQKTRVKITEYMIKKDRSSGIMRLLRGKIQSIVKVRLGRLFGLGKRNRYEVHTPTAVCGVRGTNFFTWFQGGQTGGAFQEGTGYVYGTGKPGEGRNVGTGMAFLVVSADKPPVIKPATDADLTLDVFGEPEGYSEEEEEKGRNLGGQGTTPPPPYLPPEWGTGFTEFAGGFVFNPWDVEGTISGYIENDPLFPGIYAGSGGISITGTYGETPEGSDVGDMEGTMDDGGAFSGYLSAVTGSLRGVYSNIFVTGGSYVEDEEIEGYYYLNNADIGFLHGAFSGNLVEGEESGTLSASGTAFRSNILGKVGEINIGALEEGESRQDALARALPENFVDWEYPLPILGAINAGGGEFFGGEFSVAGIDFGGLETTSGRRLGVWAVATEGGEYTNEIGSTWYGMYGEEGRGYYVLGSITGHDDSFDETLGEGEFGHIDISGRLTYLDHEYMGDIYLWYRGSYYEGESPYIYDSAGAGTYTLDPLAWSGNWGGYDGGNHVVTSLYAHDGFGNMVQAGEDVGIIGGTSGAPGYGTVSFLAMGTYDDEGDGGTYLFNTPIMGETVGEVPYSIFTGYTGGFWKEPAPDSTYGNVSGNSVALYLTGDGTAGFLTGGVSGYYYPGLGMWMTEGTLASKQMATGLNLSFSPPGDLYGSLAGDFNGTGEIYGWTYSGQTMFLYDSASQTSLPWGIYDLKLGDYNYYSSKPEGNAPWSAVVGGNGQFGYEGGYGYDYGYWLATAGGTWSADGEISGNLEGIYLTEIQRGNLGGPCYGTNSYVENGSGTWIGQSIGIFEGQPLAWSGDWGNWGDSLLYNSYGYIGNKAGHDVGLFGLTERGGGGDYDLLAIGQYMDWGYGGGGYGGPYVWSSSIDGDVVTGGYDGGYDGLEGFTGGFWKKGSAGAMDGHAVAIYYTNDGKVGLLSGGVLGNFYEMYEDGYGGMWMAEGTLTNKEKTPPEGYDPYNASINEGYLNASLAGHFGTGSENTIFGEYYSEAGNKTKFITYYDGGYQSLPWGIYNLKLGDGSDFNYYWGKPAGNPSWSAKIGGEGRFGYDGYDGQDEGFWLADIGSTWYEYQDEDYGTIDGDLTGTYLTLTHRGIIEGPFYGLYTEYGVEEDGGFGTWVGLSVGTYEGTTPLDFGGTWWLSLLYNDDGEIDWSSGREDPYPYPEGRFGLTQRGDGNYDILTIGKYWEYGYGGGGYGGPYVWSGSLYGNEIIDGGYGGGYDGLEGFTGGSWKKGSAGTMDGHAVAIYYTDDGKVGLLSGGVLGNFYEIGYGGFGYGGMWMAEGTLTNKEMPTPEGYDPYNASINEGYLEASLAGHFGAGSENTIFGEYYNGKTKFITYNYGAESLPWGIYNLKLGDGEDVNYYWGKPAGNPSWSAKIGGEGRFGYDGYDGQDEGYWLADIGSTWYEYQDEDYGTIDGDLTGTYLTLTHRGIIEGPFYGLYTGEESGTWVGLSVGTYEGEPLDHSGDLIGLKFSTGGYGGYGGYVPNEAITGLMGGTLYESQTVTFMGKHNTNTPLWAMGIIGGMVDDGTLFFSLLDFSSSDSQLTGNAVGIYMGSDGYGGFLNYSGITGTHYPGIGMWEAEGTLTLREHENVVPNFGELMMEPIVGMPITIDDTFEGGALGTSAYFDGEDWGIFRFVAGGSNVGDEEGYWLAPAIGECYSSGYGGGYFNLYYLTESVMGSFSGWASTTYPYDFTDWSLGVPEGIEPDGVAYWGEEGDCLYYYDIGQVGSDWGLIGIVQGDGSNFDYLAMGMYEDFFGIGYEGAYLWASNIYDEEDYIIGFTGGIWNNGEMDGAGVALYEGGSAGILTGNVLGNYYEFYGYEGMGYGGMWMAKGTFEYVEMTDGSIYGEVEALPINFAGYGGFDGGGTITVMSSEGEAIYFDDQDWGIWATMIGGTYTGPTSEDWALSLSNIVLGPEIHRWAEVVGSKWDDTDNTIAGKVAGAWVNLGDVVQEIEPSTGVLGGELKGTFDPTEMWQAVAAGAYMETTKFLEMVNNNPAALQTLNIPYIEIGRTSLTGNGGNLTSVNMNDVTFFGYSTGAMPRIWATGDVNGTNDGNPAGSTALLNGNGFSNVNFHMNNWGDAGGNWDASVNGSGTVGGHGIDMTGGAAGTVDTATTFSGTGAGVAKPD